MNWSDVFLWEENVHWGFSHGIIMPLKLTGENMEQHITLRKGSQRIIQLYELMDWWMTYNKSGCSENAIINFAFKWIMHWNYTWQYHFWNVQHYINFPSTIKGWCITNEYFQNINWQIGLLSNRVMVTLIALRELNWLKLCFLHLLTSHRLITCRSCPWCWKYTDGDLQKSSIITITVDMPRWTFKQNGVTKCYRNTVSH